MDKEWIYFNENISPLVNEIIEKRHPKAFWYEVWIDLSDYFKTDVWPHIKDLPIEAAAEWTFQYLLKRDRFYSSPHYCEMLDRLVDNIKEDEWISPW